MLEQRNRSAATTKKLKRLQLFKLLTGSLVIIHGNQGEAQKIDTTEAFTLWAEDLARQSTQLTREIMETQHANTKCRYEGQIEDDVKASHPKIRCFVSFSIPIETLIELSQALQLVGGVFVLKGLPNNSFKEFAVKLQELRERGVSIPFLIDPRAFKEHLITEAPTFVVHGESQFWKVSGNVSLDYVLSYVMKQENKYRDNLRKGAS